MNDEEEEWDPADRDAVLEDRFGVQEGEDPLGYRIRGGLHEPAAREEAVYHVRREALRRVIGRQELLREFLDAILWLEERLPYVQRLRDIHREEFFNIFASFTDQDRDQDELQFDQFTNFLRSLGFFGGNETPEDIFRWFNAFRGIFRSVDILDAFRFIVQSDSETAQTQNQEMLQERCRFIFRFYRTQPNGGLLPMDLVRVLIDSGEYSVVQAEYLTAHIFNVIGDPFEDNFFNLIILGMINIDRLCRIPNPRFNLRRRLDQQQGSSRQQQ